MSEQRISQFLLKKKSVKGARIFFFKKTGKGTGILPHVPMRSKGVLA